MSEPHTIYQTPPLAGRPPFATDDDSVYDQQPQQPTRRLRQPPPPDPNARTSAYNMYGDYLDGNPRDSGVGALGMGMMNGGDTDDEDDDDPFSDSKKASSPSSPTRPAIPLAAPKPGYAAPVAALQLPPPSPVASPDGRQPSPEMSQYGGPKPLTLVTNMNNSPRMPPPAAINVPSTPHPLPPTMTPIMPVFARPSTAQDRDVKFAATTPILRSDKEETLLPKRGERGDDFWRRFSIVVKEENSKAPGQKDSPWLRKTTNGTTRMSRWVWIIGIFLLICVAGGIGIGWWIAHNDKSHDAPTAIGGSANEKALSSSAAAATSVGTDGHTKSSSPHVSPTNTVARRAFLADVVPTGVPVVPIPEVPAIPIGSPKFEAREFDRAHRQHNHHRRAKALQNRTTH
ncbi:hypothetical protein C8Q75DRAFT_806779 [Abortiporus biennis]|nr:hypothetical protein C8Q75DRAFT_806779 [Abortiporus biennis]